MIIADTGFWLALVNEADRHHAEAKARLSDLSTDQRDFGAYRWKQRRPFENLLIGF